jgi:hypothetical protein
VLDRVKHKFVERGRPAAGDRDRLRSERPADPAATPITPPVVALAGGPLIRVLIGPLIRVLIGPRVRVLIGLGHGWGA